MPSQVTRIITAHDIVSVWMFLSYQSLIQNSTGMLLDQLNVRVRRSTKVVPTQPVIAGRHSSWAKPFEAYILNKGLGPRMKLFVLISAQVSLSELGGRCRPNERFPGTDDLSKCQGRHRTHGSPNWTSQIIQPKISPSEIGLVGEPFDWINV
jgi:hypothetical protein